jgi:hypothetical protein
MEQEHLKKTNKSRWNNARTDLGDRICWQILNIREKQIVNAIKIGIA